MLAPVPEEKMKTRTTIWVAVLSAIGLFIPTDTPKTLSGKGIGKMPSYAGLTEVQAGKNFLAIVGDTQGTSAWEFWRERNDRERKLILDEINHRKPAFVVNLGDLTTWGGSNKPWQEFDDRHRAFRENKTPYFPILGNHEFYGNDEKALENYFGRFPHLGQRRWYSFTWKNVGWVMTDSSFSKLTRAQTEQQLRWYFTQLEKFEKMAEVDFVVVCCHEPPFTNSRVVPPSKETEVGFAVPFLKFHKTRLFLSGHSHSYERFQKKDKIFVVSGGGGGPRHKVSIDPRKRRYHDLFSGPELRFFHFCEIEVRHDALAVRVVRLEPDETFTAVDTFIIQKF